jgi:hypothetical protein
MVLELTNDALAESRRHFEMAKNDKHESRVTIQIRLRHYALRAEQLSRLIDREIVAARAMGTSFPEIGKILGITKQAATQRHASALKRTRQTGE